jgi:hypothetical protein
VTDDGMSMLCRAEQLWNVLSWIDVTEDGISTLVRVEQYSNMPMPSVLMEAESLTLASLLQELNVHHPLASVTESGM